MSGVGTPRNVSKAMVRVERRGNREVVVKDYGARSWLTRRVFGRPALRREARAYRALAELEGVPRCLGFEGPDALMIEKAPGRSLSDWDPAALPDGVFERLERLVERIHRRGVALADLHRSNVVVACSGEVAIVDFALALTASPGRTGLLWRLAARLDRHAVARIRAWGERRAEPPPEGVFGLLYRLGRAGKTFIRQRKRLS